MQNEIETKIKQIQGAIKARQKDKGCPTKKRKC